MYSSLYDPVLISRDGFLIIDLIAASIGTLRRTHSRAHRQTRLLQSISHLSI